MHIFALVSLVLIVFALASNSKALNLKALETSLEGDLHHDLFEDNSLTSFKSDSKKNSFEKHKETFERLLQALYDNSQKFSKSEIESLNDSDSVSPQSGAGLYTKHLIPNENQYAPDLSNDSLDGAYKIHANDEQKEADSNFHDSISAIHFEAQNDLLSSFALTQTFSKSFCYLLRDIMLWSKDCNPNIYDLQSNTNFLKISIRGSKFISKFCDSEAKLCSRKQIQNFLKIWLADDFKSQTYFVFKFAKYFCALFNLNYSKKNQACAQPKNYPIKHLVSVSENEKVFRPVFDNSLERWIIFANTITTM